MAGGGELASFLSGHERWVVARVLLDDVVNDLPVCLLSEEERAGLYRMRHKPGRVRHVIGRCLVRSVLAPFYDCEPWAVPIAVDAKGRPYCEGECLSFNITHSGDCVLAAFSLEGRVGLDVECTSRSVKALSLARHFFHPEEVAYIEAGGDSMEERFFRIWTAKEAYCKAIGLGLGISLSSFCVESLSMERGWVDAKEPPHAVRWFVPMEGYLACLSADSATAAGGLVDVRFDSDGGMELVSSQVLSTGSPGV
jgi:4'-phosphopantetheinyl transferase